MPDRVRARVAAAFAGWGIPTADAVYSAREAVPSATLIASGGVRDGIDIAKAIALGADLAGCAGPMLRAAAEGEAALSETVNVLIEQLRLAMFCTGSASAADLRTGGRIAR